MFVINVTQEEKEILKRIVNYIHKTLKPRNKSGLKEKEILESLKNKLE